MFESVEQVSQQQRRKNQIISWLFSKQTQHIHPQQYKEEVNLQKIDEQIKSFDYLITQNHFGIILQKNAFCAYNHDQKAKFICCNKYCDNHAIICGVQTCECASDHHRCIFIAIEPFLDKIISKLQQPISKQIQHYFQVKQVILQYMVNRISQERQALMEWQQDNKIESKKSLFLYDFKKVQEVAFHGPKVLCQKSSQNHKKWGYFALIIKQRDQINKQEETVQAICKKINKKYSSIINYLDQKIEILQYHRQCANLNPAQFWLIDFLRNKTYFSTENSKKETTNLTIKKMSPISGRLIYQAIKQRNKQQRSIDLEKLAAKKLKKIWQGYSERQFRLFVQGKAINQLFCLIEKAKHLQAHSAQQIKSYLEKIIQSLSQGQQHLFNKSLLKKKLLLKNVDPRRLGQKLLQYKGMKYDEVYITNDRYLTAISDMQSVKNLGNLRNVSKLEIKWCWQMKGQILNEILNKMPHLNQLALLGHRLQLPQNYIKKLCLLQQLKTFYIDYHSHPEYYRSYSEYHWFVEQHELGQNTLPSIEELLELTKFSKLENIEISFPSQSKSARIIKNLKGLKHLTLGYNDQNRDKPHVDLVKQIQKQRELRTLSLIGIKFSDSKHLNFIIANNPFLNTIIIRNELLNTAIKDDTIECMSNLTQLQTLCIFGNIGMTGKHLSKLNSLIMLEICCCSKINRLEMIKALKEMQSLQYLNLSCNQWVDDGLMMSIQQCKRLECLNIFKTSVSGEGIKNLKQLTSLSILICSCNAINGKDLIEFTKCTPRIAKLCIIKLKICGDDLLEISTNCQITHLDIRETYVQTEALLKMKRLKVVRSDLEQRQKTKLHQQGIKIY